LNYAEKVHAQQKRRNRKPYIVHPKRVAEKVEKYKGKSSNISVLKSAAFLHDTAEDDSNTFINSLKK